MKKGHFDSKTGGNGSKNWIGILRPAINEWRPKKKRERERRGKSLYQELACLFHLTENFLADAFAFLGTSRHANK